jgi:hypothetical protein
MTRMEIVSGFLLCIYGFPRCSLIVHGSEWYTICLGQILNRGLGAIVYLLLRGGWCTCSWVMALSTMETDILFIVF